MEEGILESDVVARNRRLSMLTVKKIKNKKLEQVSSLENWNQRFMKPFKNLKTFVDVTHQIHEIRTIPLGSRNESLEDPTGSLNEFSQASLNNKIEGLLRKSQKQLDGGVLMSMKEHERNMNSISEIRSYLEARAKEMSKVDSSSKFISDTPWNSDAHVENYLEKAQLYPSSKIHPRFFMRTRSILEENMMNNLMSGLRNAKREVNSDLAQTDNSATARLKVFHAWSNRLISSLKEKKRNLLGVYRDDMINTKTGRPSPASFRGSHKLKDLSHGNLKQVNSPKSMSHISAPTSPKTMGFESPKSSLFLTQFPSPVFNTPYNSQNALPTVREIEGNNEQLTHRRSKSEKVIYTSKLNKVLTDLEIVKEAASSSRKNLHKAGLESHLKSLDVLKEKMDAISRSPPQCLILTSVDSRKFFEERLKVQKMLGMGAYKIKSQRIKFNKHSNIDILC